MSCVSELSSSSIQSFDAYVTFVTDAVVSAAARIHAVRKSFLFIGVKNIKE
ncbi:hypothetical protein KA405_06845 [Patescibacteria group bacterium]|nr:hypothetical protein [Patescibacteria group bacterium]